MEKSKKRMEEKKDKRKCDEKNRVERIGERRW